MTKTYTTKNVQSFHVAQDDIILDNSDIFNPKHHKVLSVIAVPNTNTRVIVTMERVYVTTPTTRFVLVK